MTPLVTDKLRTKKNFEEVEQVLRSSDLHKKDVYPLEVRCIDRLLVSTRSSP